MVCIYKIINIFDLDDTLVCGKKYKVPKQTFHVLRALKMKGHTLVIVTYNPLGIFVAHSRGLLNYFESVVYLKNSTERSDLILSVLFYYQIEQFPFNDFIYFDDRYDNIANIQLRFPNVMCFHVRNPLTLFQTIKHVFLEQIFKCLLFAFISQLKLLKFMYAIVSKSLD